MSGCWSTNCALKERRWRGRRMIGEIRWARERAENGAMVRFVKVMDCPYFWWICFTVGFAIAAAALPTDGSYDFKNYHFYNGFSAFHDRRALDIAPAQLQTSFFYGLDPIYYAIFTRLNDHPKLINVLLSIPYSVAATTIFVIARTFARPAFVWPNLASAAAAVFGLTGASTLPTLATTESDLVPGLAILIALARWLTSREGWAQYSLDRAWHRRSRGFVGRPQAHPGAFVRWHGGGDRRPMRNRQTIGAAGGVCVRPRRVDRFRGGRRDLALGQRQNLWKSDLPAYEQCVSIGLCRLGALDRRSVPAQDDAHGAPLSGVLGLPFFERRQRIADARPAHSARVGERCCRRPRFRRPLAT